MKFLTKNACFFVTLRTSQCATAQGTVDVDRAIGDDFGAVADQVGDDEVTILRVHLLAGTHGLV